MIRNMKIRSKLMLGFAVLPVIVAVTAVFAIFFITQISNEYSYKNTYPGSRYDMLNYQAIDIMELRRLVTLMAYNAGNDAEVSAAANDIRRVRQSLVTRLNAYRQNLEADPRVAGTVRGVELLGIAWELDAYVTRYVNEVTDPMYSAAFAGDLDEIARIIPLGGEIFSQLDYRFNYLMNAAQTTKDEIREGTSVMISTSGIVMLSLTVTGVILGIIAAFWIAAMLTKPILEVSQVINSVSNGELAVNVKTGLSQDEAGIMTQNAYNMVNTLKNMIEDLSSIDHEINVAGNMNYRLDTNKYQNAFRTMIENINKVVQQQVNDIKDITGALKQISEGDFNINADSWVMPGDFSFVPETINAVTVNLLGVVNEINMLVNAAAVKGDFSHKIDAGKYEGGWREIMTGLNDIAEAVDTPLKVILLGMEEMCEGIFDLEAIDKKINEAGYSADPASYAGTFNKIISGFESVIETTASYIQIISDDLKAIASGDLTTSVTQNLKGDYAEIKDSLNKISSSLNKTMSEINSASEQVLSGAKQISASAVDLANGASAQANSVVELNASVDLINRQTRQNAKSASLANVLSQTSTDNAKEGNNAMQQTLSAMNQIRDASNNISKIIHTIQDIAFQTNLLALNAAVEAACAGEHGKGFAVVAEEVRNLAARSQTAASETTELIGTSISTVETGSEIARFTAETLDTIVENANKVLDIVGSISTASQEQAEAISQVVTGLQQISQVVQSTSAVSEETAAASEELTSQAELLQQLVLYFKLSSVDRNVQLRQTSAADRSRHERWDASVEGFLHNEGSGLTVANADEYLSKFCLRTDMPLKRAYLCDRSGTQLSHNIEVGTETVELIDYRNKNWAWRTFFRESLEALDTGRRSYMTDSYRDVTTKEEISTYAYRINSNMYLFMDVLN